MAIYLKQSTATTIVVGPMVDETDGKTDETGLTISHSDVLLWKQGGTGMSAKNESSSATHRSNGCYTVPLDTTDTNTLGQLIVSVHEVGALPVRHDFQVMPANAWDSLFGADKLQVDAVELNSVAASAANLEKSASVILRGTVDTTNFSPTTTQFEADDITEATADHYKGRVIVFTSGALLGQATSISAYALATGRGHFTIAALTESPANDSTFVIV
jgi:hypothetical protein